MTYPCPNCRRPLKSEPAKDGAVTVWCPNGRCLSDAAQAGATGSTVEQAVGRLIEAVDGEADVIP